MTYDEFMKKLDHYDKVMRGMSQSLEEMHDTVTYCNNLADDIINELGELKDVGNRNINSNGTL